MPDTKIRNPFIHSHEHDHDHGDGHHHHDEPFEPVDPAQQSLADALQVSFTVLKFVMVGLLVIYLFSGVFRVETDQAAVRLRFGRIVGQPGQEVYGQGWHIGLPYPFEQTITVPVNQQQLTIDNAFWFEPPRGAAGRTLDEMAGASGPLNPERDGSLLTGDANIVHGRFNIAYRIEDPAAFVRNVGSLELAQQLVRNAAEQGIVHAVAQMESDEFVRSRFDAGAAQERIREVLEGMETGLEVERLTLVQQTVPLPVRGAYQAMVNAESERAQLVEDARRQYTSALNEAAGEGYEPLFALVSAYELARDAGDQERADQLFQQIDQALTTLTVPTAQGPVRIGGQVATIINGARTDRTETVQRIKADADSFLSQLELYRENPAAVRERLWQQARAQIFTGEVETFYSPTGEMLTISLNRDPEIARQREQQRLQQQQEEARQRAQQNR